MKTIKFSGKEMRTSECKRLLYNDDYTYINEYEECDCCDDNDYKDNEFKCEFCNSTGLLIKGIVFTKKVINEKIDNLVEAVIKRHYLSDDETSLMYHASLNERAFNNHYVVNDKQAYIDFISENYNDETVANEITSIEKNGYIVIECKEDRELAEEILMDGVIEPRFSSIKKVEEGLFNDYNEFEFVKYLINKGYFGKIYSIYIEHGYDSQDHQFVVESNRIKESFFDYKTLTANNFNYDKNVVDAILEGKITI